MTHVVEYLPSKLEALSSNSSTTDTHQKKIMDLLRDLATRWTGGAVRIE
jgi:hypothetical protein